MTVVLIYLKRENWVLGEASAYETIKELCN